MKYQHDCNRCTPLGEFEFDGHVYDLYACATQTKLVSLVARAGNDGSDYHSRGMWRFGETDEVTDCVNTPGIKFPPIVEAARRLIKLEAK